MIRRPMLLLLVTSLVGLYGYRAVAGWIAGPAYVRGRHLAADGDYEGALPLLDRAAIGANRAATRWLAGEVRLGLWRQRWEQGAEPREIAELLAEAGGDQTAAIALSPASGWYRAALGQLYHQREILERHLHGSALEQLSDDPWTLVGRPGRIAVGLTRQGIEREPSVYPFHDQLALILLEYGLTEAALQAVRESARIQPLFHLHEYTNLRRIPEPLLDAFAEASRASLGQTPLLRRMVHLVALGKVELRRSRHAQAEQDLRSALEEGGTVLEQAEARFHLGLALAGQGRNGEALEQLALAARDETMRPASILSQARITRDTGELDRSLQFYRASRRLEPRRVDVIIEFADVAGRLERWDQALQALEWGRLVHPRSPDIRAQLVRHHIARGDSGAAREAWAELEQLPGAEATLAELARELTGLTPGAPEEWRYIRPDSRGADPEPGGEPGE